MLLHFFETSLLAFLLTARLMKSQEKMWKRAKTREIEERGEKREKKWRKEGWKIGVTGDTIRSNSKGLRSTWQPAPL